MSASDGMETMDTAAPLTRDAVVETLRKHRKELEAHGVLHASLFGSVARGDDSNESDIDIAVSFPPGAAFAGSAYLRNREELRRRLSELLGRRVDLSDEAMLRARVRETLKGESVRAF